MHFMQQLVGTTHHMVGVTKETAAITSEVRDNIADFDDTFRPIRSYFYCGTALLQHPGLLGDQVLV